MRGTKMEPLLLLSLLMFQESSSATGGRCKINIPVPRETVDIEGSRILKTDAEFVEMCRKECCSGLYESCSPAASKNWTAKFNCLHFHCGSLEKCRFLPSSVTVTFVLSKSSSTLYLRPFRELCNGSRYESSLNVSNFFSKSHVSEDKTEESWEGKEKLAIEKKNFPTDKFGSSPIKPSKQNQTVTQPSSKKSSLLSSTYSEPLISDSSTSFNINDISISQVLYPKNVIYSYFFRRNVFQEHSSINYSVKNSSSALNVHMTPPLENVPRETADLAKTLDSTLKRSSLDASILSASDAPKKIALITISSFLDIAIKPSTELDIASLRKHDLNSKAYHDQQTTDNSSSFTLSSSIQQQRILLSEVHATETSKIFTPQHSNEIASNISPSPAQEVQNMRVSDFAESSTTDGNEMERKEKQIKFESSMYLVMSLVFGLLVLCVVIGVVMRRMYITWITRRYHRLDAMADEIGAW